MRIGYVIADNVHLAWAKQCGFDFLEIKGDFLLQLSRTGNLEELNIGNLSIEVMTSPLPREFGARIVGNDADHRYALKIFTQMLDLSAKLGVRKIVFGSGQARNVPGNFSHSVAFEQYLDFINKAYSLCRDRNQILTIEPLHRGETNLINSCVETQNLIKDFPDVSITADCYHIYSEHLSVDAELSNNRITHSHTSYLPRGSGIFLEEYQLSFVKKLQELGCNTLSIEEKFNSYVDMAEILSRLGALCKLPLVFSV